MNESKKEDEKTIYMIVAYGVEFENEQMHEVLWARDEKQARDTYESQYDHIFGGRDWGWGEWGPEWDTERLAFGVVLLRVPETWPSLVDECGMIWLPKSHKTEYELLRYLYQRRSSYVLRKLRNWT